MHEVQGGQETCWLGGSPEQRIDCVLRCVSVPVHTRPFRQEWRPGQIFKEGSELHCPMHREGKQP